MPTKQICDENGNVLRLSFSNEVESIPTVLTDTQSAYYEMVYGYYTDFPTIQEIAEMIRKNNLVLPEHFTLSKIQSALAKIAKREQS